MRGFTDIHQHLIYGVDDGPRTLEQMIAMLEAAVADGITEIFATAHMEPGIELFDLELYNEHLAEARNHCVTNQLPLTIHPGAEVMYTPHMVRYLRNGRILTLSSTPYLLLEFLPTVKLTEIQEAVESIRNCGYFSIIAHIERYPSLMKKMDTAVRMKETYSASYQMNASTILKPQGLFQNRFVKKFLDADLVDYVGTDAHDTATRRVCLTQAYKQLKEDYDKPRAARLTGLNGNDISMFCS